ncbi:MAG TPA: aquaporin [Streptosporangiaceae bacterium]
MNAAIGRRLLAELLGSMFLAATVVGSGIAAQRLSPGNTGLKLLENAAATAAGLFAIILMFGPVSGGHFNPAVSFADAVFGGLSWRDATAYVPVQVAGCIGGAVLANLMFALPAVNPAITIGRMFSDTFAGIAPAAAPSFIAAQLLGGALAVMVIRALYPAITPAQAAGVLVPPPPSRTSPDESPAAGLPAGERPLS